MANIKVLSQDLINKIAAGEVVERPASVVKELVENAIDADAKNILIEIENGGINLIKVTDDGTGMSAEDAELAVKQHATSKISDEADLFNIGTLGFRGEALASISSVSKFQLITRQEASLSAEQILVENSNVKTFKVGAPVGTSISVTNLFYNVPARQKYLKTAVTELNHIVDLFFNYVLTYPEIGWKLYHNNKPVYQFPPADIKIRIYDVFGEEISQNLIPVDFVLNNICVTGFVGKPQIARNNRKLQYLFVNRRPVNEYVVAKQVKDAFGTLIMNNLYPVYILNLEVLNDEVDVNVHPRKLEVRFSNPQIIYRSVYKAVANALDDANLTKTIIIDEVESEADNNPLKTNQSNLELPKQPQKSFHPSFSSVGEVLTKKQINNNPINPDLIKSVYNVESSVDSISAEINFNILGQVAESYIIVKTKQGLKIYDQHATSERVQYQKIIKQWEIGELASQKMLIPQNIELSPSETSVLSLNLAVFNRLGYDINQLSGNTFTVSAVPQFLQNQEIKPIILEILAELSEEVIDDNKIAEPINRIFKMMSCKSAIKFGDLLTEAGMIALINDLELIEDNRAKYTCVHGRPCVIEYTFNELEKLFKRK